MPLFAREFRFLDQARRMEVRPAHRDHLRALLGDGRLRMAGPWADDTGALVVYDVADEDEARRLVAADPYTEAGGVVEEIALREWTLVFPPPVAGH